MADRSNLGLSPGEASAHTTQDIRLHLHRQLPHSKVDSWLLNLMKTTGTLPAGRDTTLWTEAAIAASVRATFAALPAATANELCRDRLTGRTEAALRRFLHIEEWTAVQSLSHEPLDVHVFDDFQRQVLLNERLDHLWITPRVQAPDEPSFKTCRFCYDSRGEPNQPCGCFLCHDCAMGGIRCWARESLIKGAEDTSVRGCCASYPLTFHTAGPEAIPYILLKYLPQQIKHLCRTLPSMRVFCCNPHCEEFIGKRRNPMPEDGRTMQCVFCAELTCGFCAAPAHRGYCRRYGEAEREAYYDTLDAEKMAHCPDCGIVVQLAEACNHMTCPCGCEFCYVCGKHWRLDPHSLAMHETCGCPLYNGIEGRVPTRMRPGTPFFKPVIPMARIPAGRIPLFRAEGHDGSYTLPPGVYPFVTMGRETLLESVTAALEGPDEVEDPLKPMGEMPAAPEHTNDGEILFDYDLEIIEIE